MGLNASTPQEPAGELRSPLLDLSVALIEDSVDRVLSRPSFQELGPTAQMRDAVGVLCLYYTEQWMSSWSALLNIREGTLYLLERLKESGAVTQAMFDVLWPLLFLPSGDPAPRDTRPLERARLTIQQGRGGDSSPHSHLAIMDLESIAGPLSIALDLTWGFRSGRGILAKKQVRSEGALSAGRTGERADEPAP